MALDNGCAEGDTCHIQQSTFVKATGLCEQSIMALDNSHA